MYGVGITKKRGMASKHLVSDCNWNYLASHKLNTLLDPLWHSFEYQHVMDKTEASTQQTPQDTCIWVHNEDKLL